MGRFILVLLASFFLASPGAMAFADETPLLPSKPGTAFRGMWSVAWMWDTDDDRIDDRLARSTGPTRIVVDFDHRPTDADIAALEALGFDTDYRARHIDSVTGTMDAGGIPAIGDLPGVARIEMELVYHTLNNIATQAMKARPSGTYANTVWDDLGYRGQGVTIAVVDTGVDDHQHEAFTGKYVCGYDSVAQIVRNPDDDNEHGTHVAGTSLGHGGTATYPYGTNAGVAPEAKLVDLKVLSSSGSSSGSSVLRGIEWAIDNRVACGIDIMTLSLGTLFADDGTSSDAQAVNAASNAGIISTIAVGNHQTFLDDFGIASPSSADTAISVAAMNDKNTVTRNDDTVASFSNTGPRNSDGDGDSQDEKKPEVITPGQSIMSARYNTANGYQSLSGTSMATPAMAGLVALMLEANPALTWADVEDIVIQTSQDYGAGGWDGRYGYGYADGYAAVLEAEARAGGGTNADPNACFTHSESALTTSLNSACSSDSDGTITTWAWTFGDGGTSNAASPSHTYATDGTYTVTLTVTDNDGASDSTSAAVTVAAASNMAPNACFSTSTSGLGASADAACSNDPDGSITAYAWNWGDGATDSGASASHTYSSDGTYTVTLTVTDNDGATDTATQSVTVTNDPDPGATTLTSGQSMGDSIQGVGSEKFYKILVPAGTGSLSVVLDGPSCGLISCNPDLDLYVRKGARPTDSAYDCRPYEGDSDESCTLANPGADWWYVRVKVFGGSSAGSYTVTATAS